MQVSKHVLNEILNHSRLQHPHIVNFGEVSTFSTKAHPSSPTCIYVHWTASQKHGQFQRACKSHCRPIQAFSFYSLPSSCRDLVATVSFPLLQCLAVWASWSISSPTWHEVHAEACLVWAISVCNEHFVIIKSVLAFQSASESFLALKVESDHNHILNSITAGVSDAPILSHCDGLCSRRGYVWSCLAKEGIDWRWCKVKTLTPACLFYILSSYSIQLTYRLAHFWQAVSILQYLLIINTISACVVQIFDKHYFWPCCESDSSRPMELMRTMSLCSVKAPTSGESGRLHSLEVEVIG